MAAKPDFVVEFIDISKIKFEYNSINQRVRNFFLKTFLKRNLKKEYRINKIRGILEKNGFQDVILVIRPDLLDESLLIYASSRANRFISFYFDAIKNIPEKSELISFFDEVYSYEKADVQEHDLKFITNFIPFDEFHNAEDAHGVFNISSYDSRSVFLEEIAQQLQEVDYPYKFIVKYNKDFESDFLEVIQSYLDCKDVQEFIKTADILLDIQKENQQGLSFRVFEALGADKKLITTNADVKNYDFYNPDNILIIDKNKPVIPLEFLDKKVVPVAKEIKDKYRRDHWIQEVFGIK